MKIASGKPLPITDFRMTRYMVTLPQAVEAVWLAFTEMHGGEIFVSKVPSMKVVDVASAINHEAQLKEVGIRPGEKLHEQMVGTEDAQFTFDYGAYYKILSPICNWYQDEERIGNGKPVSPDFFYRSDTNEQWMTKEELSLWIDDNKLKIGIV
jgi:FlaA1/EpsC-like NDP-sugar epimerase